MEHRLINSDEYYSPSDIDWILLAVFEFQYPSRSSKGVCYWDVPIAFDIEVTSFYSKYLDSDKPVKSATMYEWTLGIDGYCIVGRTWDEFSYVMGRITWYLDTSLDNRIVVYVHNLAYEFQFIRKRFDWDTVFSVDMRKPLYAVTKNGIEFRCSYLLSGYSLEKLGDELQKYNVRKMVGDLDYSLMRHSKTLLTKAEIGYCLNDVKVVMCYIQERLDEEGHIYNIPMTKTGYVRRHCRLKCLGNKAKTRTKAQWDYVNTIKSLTLDADEYRQLRRCFQGGFTHASPFYSCKVMEKVSSYDFTSSYPTVMVAERFPMGKSEYLDSLTRTEFRDSIDLYCCMFDVKFYNIRAKFHADNYISSSHCPILEHADINNGRVVSASELLTTITDVDFRIIEGTYEWDYMDVRNFRRYPRGYLPTEFVKAVLDLYKDKTELKGVEGREVDYMVAKGMLNSCYGMTVTDIGKDDIVYLDGEWDTEEVDLAYEMDKYNKNRGRFLFYPWGVWITAYARRNLWNGIFECGDDYLYSDTDSIKIINAEKHSNYLDSYNDWICRRLERALDHHGLPYDLYKPKSIDGKEHPLGVWDYEGTYDRFKTLGAKRYLVEENGKYHLTVAGLGKKIAMDYIGKQDDPFAFFDDGMYIPPTSTGKSIHTYIDVPQSGTFKDYFGVEGRYDELSSIHMEPCEYLLTLSREYRDFLMGIWEWY